MDVVERMSARNIRARPINLSPLWGFVYFNISDILVLLTQPVWGDICVGLSQYDVRDVKVDETPQRGQIYDYRST